MKQFNSVSCKNPEKDINQRAFAGALSPVSQTPQEGVAIRATSYWRLEIFREGDVGKGQGDGRQDLG